MKTFNQFLTEHVHDLPREQKPDIFTHTAYRLPTEADLEDIHSHSNLTAEEIRQGFGYTIVGRGVDSEENRKMILDSLGLLCRKYPDNKVYQEALGIEKKKQEKEPPFRLKLS